MCVCVCMFVFASVQLCNVFVCSFLLQFQSQTGHYVAVMSIFGLFAFLFFAFCVCFVLVSFNFGHSFLLLRLPFFTTHWHSRFKLNIDFMDCPLCSVIFVFHCVFVPPPNLCFICSTAVLCKPEQRVKVRGKRWQTNSESWLDNALDRHTKVYSELVDLQRNKGEIGSKQTMPLLSSHTIWLH